MDERGNIRLLKDGEPLREGEVLITEGEKQRLTRVAKPKRRATLAKMRKMTTSEKREQQRKRARGEIA